MSNGDSYHILGIKVRCHIASDEFICRQKFLFFTSVKTEARQERRPLQSMNAALGSSMNLANARVSVAKGTGYNPVLYKTLQVIIRLIASMCVLTVGVILTSSVQQRQAAICIRSTPGFPGSSGTFTFIFINFF